LLSNSSSNSSSNSKDVSLTRRWQRSGQRYQQG